MAPAAGALSRRTGFDLGRCRKVEQLEQVASLIALRATTEPFPLLGVNETCCSTCSTSRASVDWISFRVTSSTPQPVFPGRLLRLATYVSRAVGRCLRRPIIGPELAP